MYKINRFSAEQIIDSGEAKYWQDVKDVLASNKITVNFAEMCSIKNIKPKLGIQRWQYKKLQADRVCSKYPASYEMAWFFKLSEMPPVDADIQPSSWQATVYYIEAMYGKQYAQGFEPAERLELRKAA